MANPRHGYNPLNPLSLHSENQYRPTIFEAGAAITKTFVKETAEAIAEKALKQLPEGTTQAQKLTLKEAIQVATERAGLDEIATNPNVGEAALRKTMTSQADDVLAKNLDNVVAISGKEIAEESKKSFLQANAGKIGFSALGVGSVAGLYTVAGLLGSQAMTEVLDDLTGGKCDENAIAAGYTEGTDEFKSAVEACQRRAERRLTYIGVSAIVVGGGVVFLLLKW